MHGMKRTRADVTNADTGESVTRIQWSRDRKTVTVYTNFGVWRVFSGEQAQMVNAAFVNAMNAIEHEMGSTHADAGTKEAREG